MAGLKHLGSAIPPTDVATDMAEAVADLQMRVTYQEDEIQHLNQVLEAQRVALGRQQARIDALHRLVAALAQSQREQHPDAPPPHY